MPSEGAKGVPESLLTPPWELHRSEQLGGMHLTFSCSSGILPAGAKGGRSWHFKDTAQCPLLEPQLYSHQEGLGLEEAHWVDVQVEA